jgi:hypothetical protein
MTAGIWNITIEQGATFDRSVTWNDSNGNPVPLAGLTARMHIRHKLADANPILVLTTENGGITLTSPGAVSLFISSTDTAALTIKTGVYDLEIVDPSDTPERVTRFLSGMVTVIPEVTR